MPGAAEARRRPVYCRQKSAAYRTLRGLLTLEQRRDDAAPLARHFRRRAAGDMHAHVLEDVIDAVVGRHFRQHLPIIGGDAESSRIERDLAEQAALDRIGEFL